jgi:hypothetical protein
MKYTFLRISACSSRASNTDITLASSCGKVGQMARITLEDVRQDSDMSMVRYERGAYNTQWDLDCLLFKCFFWGRWTFEKKK